MKDARKIEHENSLTGNIARTPGKPKTCGKPPEIHSGMSRKQVSKAGLGDLSHPFANAPDAAAANPLDPTTVGKRLTPPKFKDGMRSRGPVTRTEEEHHAHGRRVMEEGIKAGNSKLPPVSSVAHGGAQPVPWNDMTPIADAVGMVRKPAADPALTTTTRKRRRL